MMIANQIPTSSPLRKKLVSQALKDPLFYESLSTAAKEIQTSSKNAPNEATIESLFERVLYAVLRDIGISFHPEKEIPIATRRHTAKGRTDSRIGALVIEYKQPSTLTKPADIKSAKQQLLDYLQSISKEVGNEAVGYLIDGIKLLEMRAYEDGTTSESAFSSIDK
jgi:hypothetical protein